MPAETKIARIPTARGQLLTARRSRVCCLQAATANTGKGKARLAVCLSQHLQRHVRATAAAGRATGHGAQVSQITGTGISRFTHGSIGDSVADADVHGRSGIGGRRHSSANANDCQLRAASLVRLVQRRVRKAWIRPASTGSIGPATRSTQSASASAGPGPTQVARHRVQARVQRCRHLTQDRRSRGRHLRLARQMPQGLVIDPPLEVHHVL